MNLNLNTMMDINNMKSIIEPLKEYIIKLLETKNYKGLLTENNTNLLINITIIAVVLYFVFSTINAFFKIQYIVMMAAGLYYMMKKNNIYFYQKK
jgi:hypothetical protein